jgi:signal transduction histidine kinase
MSWIWRVLGRWPVALVGVGMVIDVALAVRADEAQLRVNTWLDVGVAGAFVAAAGFARGPVVQRWLMVAVGAAWLVGSWLPVAHTAHQGVLVGALVAFPAGRARGFVRWVLTFLAVPVGLGLLTPVGVAAVCGVGAGVLLADGRRGPSSRWYPGLAMVGLASFVVVSDVAGPEGFDPSLRLLAYEVLLILIAVFFVVASRDALRERTRLADLVLGSGTPAGLEGLSGVLSRVLDDPGLRVHPWIGAAGAYLDGAGEPVVRGHPARAWLPVSDGSDPVAVVVSRSAAFEDPQIAEGVCAAVRLTVVNLRLQEQQRRRLAEVEASRSRLLAATDQVRQAMASDLRENVMAPLARVGEQVAAVRAGTSRSDPVLDVVVQELAGTDLEIAALLAGVAPTDLGNGRLGSALESVLRSSPLLVSLRVDAEVTADREIETTLFYVCCEAVTNAIKHAAATGVVVEVRRRGTMIEVRVADDGCGGADAGGSGLRGLGDRLAAGGGRLRVDSPPGAGTVVIATVPVLSRSSSRV